MPEQGSSEQLQSSSKVDEVLQGLGRDIEQRLEKSREELRLLLEEFSERLRQSEPSAPPPVEEKVPVSLSDLRDGVAQIDGAGTQAEVLARLVEQATAYASRAALLLCEETSGLTGWAGGGFGAADSAIGDGPLYTTGGWRTLLRSQPAKRISATCTACFNDARSWVKSDII